MHSTVDEALEGRVLISVQLALPRDARYVPVLRNVANCLMHELGAPEEASHDIQIALTEACANAVRHATGTTDYTVSLGVGVEGCVIEVLDQGPGFQPPNTPGAEDLDAEAGRGLLLIRSLVDDFEFLRQDDGNRLRLTKRWTSEFLSLDLPDPAPTGL